MHCASSGRFGQHCMSCIFNLVYVTYKEALRLLNLHHILSVMGTQKQGVFDINDKCESATIWCKTAKWMRLVTTFTMHCAHIVIQSYCHFVPLS